MKNTSVCFVGMVLFFLLAFFSLSSAKADDVVSGICALNGVSTNNLAGCPSGAGTGYETSIKAIVEGNPYQGARSEGAARAPIDAYGRCRWIVNAGSQAVFVPFRTAVEWDAFLNWASGQSEFTVYDCALPAPDALKTASINPGYDGCGTLTINAPNEYGKFDLVHGKGISLWPAAPNTGNNFSCHGGGATVHSSLQWQALSSTAVGRGALNWSPQFLYGPDVDFKGTDETNGTTGINLTVASGTKVKLGWTTTGAVSCSPAGFSGADVKGSAEVTPTEATTYSLTCLSDKGLTTEARVSLNIATLNGSCGTAINSCGGGVTAIPEPSSESGLARWQCPGTGGGNAIECSACADGYELVSGSCLLKCSANQTRNSDGVCKNNGCPLAFWSISTPCGGEWDCKRIVSELPPCSAWSGDKMPASYDGQTCIQGCNVQDIDSSQHDLRCDYSGFHVDCSASGPYSCYSNDWNSVACPWW
jgi:hypothetical protein